MIEDSISLICLNQKNYEILEGTLAQMKPYLMQIEEEVAIKR